MRNKQKFSWGLKRSSSISYSGSRSLELLDMEYSSMCYHIPWVGKWTVTVPSEILTVCYHPPGEIHRHQAFCDSGRAGQRNGRLCLSLASCSTLLKMILTVKSCSSPRKSISWLKIFKWLDDTLNHMVQF